MLKIKTKIILTISLLLLESGCFSPLNLPLNFPLSLPLSLSPLPTQASSAQQKWQPPGTLSSILLTGHLYQYTVSI